MAPNVDAKILIIFQSNAYFVAKIIVYSAELCYLCIHIYVRRGKLLAVGRDFLCKSPDG